jgi:hypothetical protein
MLLKETFSPVGGPKTDQSDIDWIDDLKFYMDNDDDALSDYFFPAIKKHKKYLGHPNAYMLYMKPLKVCLKKYCTRFKIEDADEKFPEEKLKELAKSLCKQQETFIKRGDYDR